MNKNGQLGMGTILVAFILVVVGVALFQSTAQTVGDATNTQSVTNHQFTAPANAARTDLLGQEVLSTPTVVYSANGTTVPGAKYTIDEVVSETTGVKTVSFRTDDASLASATLNASYNYGADGYIDSSGARSVALLISVFFALAIAVVALVPTLRSGVLSMMK